MLVFIYIIVIIDIFRVYIDHREHGNRIIHEFLLGHENLDRMGQQLKSNE